MNLLHILIICIFSLLWAWFLYNIPILAVGIKHLRRASRKVGNPSKGSRARLPMVSVIVPVKNEGRVVARLIEAFLKLEYPREKRELILAEDGSTDNTAETCERYVRQYPGQIQFIHPTVSLGKPAALNYALKFARGELIGVLDADSVPKPDMLRNAAKYFKDSAIAAIQGRTLSINADENMLTKIMSFEETTKFEVYLRGKDQLGLYLPLMGSCQFVRTETLTKVGGWNETSLAEDVEISANLTKRGYQIRYAPDVQAWQENPGTLLEAVKQRIRWYKGWIQVAMKYGTLISKPRRETVDAEITLMAPFILPTMLLLYLIFGLSLIFSQPPLFTSVIVGMVVLNALVLLGGGVSLSLFTRKKGQSRLWSVTSSLCWAFIYWGLHVAISVYSLLEFVVRRRRKWHKTVKTGAIVNQAYTRVVCASDSHD